MAEVGMGSWRLGNIRGIEVSLHWSMVALLAWGALAHAEHGPRGLAFGAALVMALSASILLHELGHSLVAQAFGVQVRGITLWPLGGIAHFERRTLTPGQEVLVSAAGPLVNGLIAAALLAGLVAVHGAQGLLEVVQGLPGHPPDGRTFAVALVASNVALGLFNLVPAFPMDGGRILRALLSLAVGHEAATVAAAWVARGLAVLLFILGVTVAWPSLLPLVAAFVFILAGQEVRALKVQKALAGVTARQALNPYAPRFTPATTVGDAARAFDFTPVPAAAVEHFGRLVGVVTRRAALAAVGEDEGSAYLASVMDRGAPEVGPEVPLDEVRLVMEKARRPYVAVVSEEGFLGLVTLAELQVAARAREGQRRGPADVSPRAPVPGG